MLDKAEIKQKEMEAETDKLLADLDRLKEAEDALDTVDLEETLCFLRVRGEYPDPRAKPQAQVAQLCVDVAQHEVSAIQAQGSAMGKLFGHLSRISGGLADLQLPCGRVTADVPGRAVGSGRLAAAEDDFEVVDAVPVPVGRGGSNGQASKKSCKGK